METAKNILKHCPSTCARRLQSAAVLHSRLSGWAVTTLFMLTTWFSPFPWKDLVSPTPPCCVSEASARGCQRLQFFYTCNGTSSRSLEPSLAFVLFSNDFSRAVGEEYLRFFDFSGQNLDEALRSFLKVVVLIGESQERERVLQHFSCRFQQSNPALFPSSGESLLLLTPPVKLKPRPFSQQHVGKSMSSSKFVSNLDGMNEGANFSKDLLKSLYNSIKSEPLPWAVDGEELKSAVLPEEDAGEDAPLRSKANPFQDVPHDKTAAVVKQGFLQRKLHADVDGKRTPWGKRGWKTFFGVLKGMVLYLLKDDYRSQTQTQEEVVGVHHSLAEPAADYTKKPFVFRLQTADWRVFLFQASSKAEMTSWIGRINLISALHSSPPFPAAVGSQRRFCRPILPASQSAHTLVPPSPPSPLPHPSAAPLSADEFDRALCSDPPEDEDEEQEEAGLKRSHSSPSLEADAAPPQLVKVRRNISERRTYRRMVVPLEQGGVSREFRSDQEPDQEATLVLRVLQSDLVAL
uniref:PH domain-containing protein n=1 Tax=Salarias fasciatus TaxID=181472 RepID=A0A672ISJ7_SALFA